LTCLDGTALQNRNYWNQLGFRIAPVQNRGHLGLSLRLILLTLLTVYWTPIACVGGIAETTSFLWILHAWPRIALISPAVMFIAL
jgi:hypothetical protein